MEELLHHINQLQKEWISLQPLSQANDTRLWDKFRLEWNYNSNHIEGNTMTYGDTKLLLRLGDEFKAQNNTLKDVNEMRAHDTAIFVIKKWAADHSIQLSEKDIRELNATILVKPFWANAITPNGQATRRLITPGQYKQYPNSVRLKSGEIFKYADPEEVVLKMEELMTWYRADEDTHPLIKAAFLHYNFVLIHPFDDGNGRVSRLLMNYHLMREGFPPVIIKSADKDNYLYALNQADAGDKNAFITYIGQQLIWSLETAIRAAKGESIEEKDDLLKEIEVWKKNVKSGIPNHPKRNDNYSHIAYIISIEKVFDTILSQTAIFKDLFLSSQQDSVFHINNKKEDVKLTSSILDNYKNSQKDTIRNFQLKLVFQGPLNKPNLENHKLEFVIQVNLTLYKYVIRIPHSSFIAEKYYDEILSKSEIDSIVQEVTKQIFEVIKNIGQGPSTL